MSKQLNLLQFEDQKAAAPEAQKTPSWQQQFAGYFFYSYKERTGQECKLKFGALKKMLNQHAQKMWFDEDTGAPEVPSFDEWKEEVDAFWSDKFAAESRGFHFSYLLKGYGSFKKFKTIKREESDPVLTWTCKGCSHVMNHPRSRWMVHKNKTGRCSKCNASFNVNDVINQTITLTDFLPKGNTQ